jgi:hypothetical protein
MYDDQAFHQTGVTTFLGIDGSTVQTWATIGLNTFLTTPDGDHWMAQGRYVGQPSSDTELVRNGVAVMETGQPIGASGVVVNTIPFWDLITTGDWFARGTAVGGGVWVARNGVVVAKTGDPIIPGSTELWGDTFLSFTGNRTGDWVLAGTTSVGDPSADAVLVLNGEIVLAREGDAVRLDLDTDGQFDDAFIGRGNNTLTAFEANDLFVSDERVVYFFANLRDAAGVDLNSNPTFGTPQAFLRIDAGEVPPCLGDLDGDLVVGLDDLAILLANYGTPSGATPEEGDLDGDTDIDLEDLALFLSRYGATC